ncbi:MAG: anaerobic ribonucleoside-triphosphate reductase activating protein [Candidatus Omnitrophica bacterium]|nr:anaerobic ribonucleoside-triphosphate reductase activating protein [Candidatus Omnitrophota bacterium]
MIIAGLQNLSLVDFPGHLAAAVFLQGCNFKCGYCQNPDLIKADRTFISPEEEQRIFEYLELRRGVIEGVVITGGEPTIHDDLCDLLLHIKEMDLKVKLDTNGSRPAILEKCLKEYLVDYLAVDIKTSPERYHEVSAAGGVENLVRESVMITILSCIPYEFRVTCVPGLVEERDIRKIAELVKGAKKVCLQQFRPVITYDRDYQDIPPHPPRRIEEFAGIMRDYVEDVQIRGL